MQQHLSKHVLSVDVFITTKHELESCNRNFRTPILKPEVCTTRSFREKLPTLDLRCHVETRIKINTSNPKEVAEGNNEDKLGRK